ncbi:hypothetical protein FA13DRAFT_1726285 [Coprinellus micaceus]|uniref:Uncharacterized protein n=1 Tax=Coprinellus micaceus TaxID=71717 RepID=A0A4Y7TT81_COPMI|nr:hypothetical protein FA13DRAFT_1726285 [Coprinellus micaceus]
MALTTDVTPRVHLTAPEILQDGARMSRLRATFCDGIFSYADNDRATRIMDESLKICGGSTEALAQILKTEFFVNHSPFYWVIANRPDAKRGVPPLFAQMLSVCTALDLATQGEILEVLYRKYASNIYAAAFSRLGRVPTHQAWNTSFFRDVDDQPMIHSQPPYSKERCTLSFTIPRFFDRLSVDNEVWFEFLAMGTLLRFKASVEGGPRWHCQFELKATKRKIRDFTWAVGLVVGSGRGHHFPSQRIAMAIRDREASCIFETKETIEEMYWRLPTFSENREISGTISLASQ